MGTILFPRIGYVPLGGLRVSVHPLFNVDTVGVLSSLDRLDRLDRLDLPHSKWVFLGTFIKIHREQRASCRVAVVRITACEGCSENDILDHG